MGILYMSALAIDGGNEMAERRQAQNCVDAAALTAGIQLATLQTQGTTLTAAQQLTAIQAAANLSLSNNGFTNGTNCTVQVNWPPQSGNFQNSHAVEVYLTFTYNNLTVNGANSVTVRAVASDSPSSTPFLPMLLLDSTGSGSFLVNGGSYTLNTANVQNNSKSATASIVEGVTGSVANASVTQVGGSSGSFNPTTKSGGGAINDPYALLPAPSTTGMTTYTQSSYSPDGSGNITLNPGYYPNGLYCINGGNVTLNAGTYYVENGNFWINTSGTVTGNGVTIYHAGSNSTATLAQSFGLDVGICLCPSSGSYTFTAPSSGTYAGVSFFQSRSYTGEAFYDFWGSGSINVGLQYFPSSTLRCWSDQNPGVINCNELVSKDFKLLGTHEIYGNTYNSGFSALRWNASRSANRPPSNVFLAE